MLEQPKIIIISKFYQTHAKISKPTGATAPVEKGNEISSNEGQNKKSPVYKVTHCVHSLLPSFFVAWKNVTTIF